MDGIDYWQNLGASPFQGIRYSSPVSETLDSKGHSQAYWAITSEYRVALLVILQRKTDTNEWPRFEVISVEQWYDRHLREYCLLIELLDDSYREEFSYVCSGLVEVIRRSTSQSMPNKIKGKLGKWASLTHTKGKMSAAAQQGLVGELSFLEEIIPIYGTFESVGGWRGPIKKPQDFVFSSAAIEVKSKKKDTKSSLVTINGITQLKVHPGEFLYLYVSRLDKTPKGDTLPEIVSRVGNTLKQRDDQAWKLFHSVLIDYGYSEDRVNNQKWISLEPSCYRIVDDFPRITRDKLNTLGYGLSLRSYSVDLDYCEEFRIDKSRLLAELTEIHNTGTLQPRPF